MSAETNLKLNYKPVIKNYFESVGQVGSPFFIFSKFFSMVLM
jgi:hypothetical protein